MDEVATNMPLLHLRLQAGRPIRTFACEGSHLEIGQRQVFGAPGTVLAREFTFDGHGQPTCLTRNLRCKRGEISP